MFSSKPRSDYLTLDAELMGFNEGVEKLRGILRKQVDDIKNDHKHPFEYKEKQEDNTRELLNKEFNNLKAKIQQEMVQENQEYNTKLELADKAAQRGKIRKQQFEAKRKEKEQERKRVKELEDRPIQPAADREIYSKAEDSTKEMFVEDSEDL